MQTEKLNGRIHKPQTTPHGIAWADEIPDDGPELFVLRMKGNKCLTFTSWARKFRGVWYHWMKGHSAPHLDLEKACPGCKAMQPKKWKAYLHCYCSEMRQEVFLELTPGAAKSLQDLLAHRQDWRGAVFQLKRVGGDNGRLTVHIMTPMGTPEQLPPEKDPRPALLKLWGLTQEQVDAWLNPESDQEGEIDFH